MKRQQCLQKTRLYQKRAIGDIKDPHFCSPQIRVGFLFISVLSFNADLERVNHLVLELSAMRMNMAPFVSNYLRFNKQKVLIQVITEAEQ